MVVVCLLVGVAALRADDAAFPEPHNTQKPGDAPPSAEEAAKLWTLPEGFDLTVFAAEPHVQQPIAFEIDDRGRLWVVENYTYQGQGFDGKLRDRIIILEDTDGDGRFDKRRVFWARGNRLTGTTLGFGGVWILNDGALQFIADRDHDDTPDAEPISLLDGFNRDEVSHNIVNGLMWGPDGWLYGRHGIQATSHVGPPGATESQRERLNCCIWRFHPTRHSFEVVCRGTTNPWGLDYNEHGEMFFTNNVNGHLWHVVPGAYYKRMYGVPFRRHLYELMDQTADHNHWDDAKTWNQARGGAETDRRGGGHSHAGAMIYQGDNWPERYRGLIFMCNTHGRRINCDALVRRGGGYVGKHRADFAHANQPWFRGVDLKYGPDGGVYVTDWVDLGECHDHDGVHRTSGRVYKITYAANRHPPDRVALNEQTSNATLVELQRHRNAFYARRARRVLQERADAGRDMGETHRALRAMFKQSEDVTHRLRAMWALHVTGGADGGWLAGCLHDKSEYVRAWGVRLLTDGSEAHVLAADQMFYRSRDETSELVRSHLISAMRKVDDLHRWVIALGLLSRVDPPLERTQSLMLWYAMEPAVARDPEHAIGLLLMSRHAFFRRFVARRITSMIDLDSRPTEQLVRLLDDGRACARCSDILTGMTQALAGRRRVAKPRGWDEAVVRLRTSADWKQFERMVNELSVVFGDGRAVEELIKLARDGGADPQPRRDAIAAVARDQPEGFDTVLLNLIGDRAVGPEAIRALAVYGQPATAKKLIDGYVRFRRDQQVAAIETLSARPAWAKAMLDAVGDGRIPRRDITAWHAQRIASHGDEQLAALLRRHWGALNVTQAETRAMIERLRAALTPEVIAEADLPNGRLLFDERCASCHTLHGVGGRIGPDLTGGNRDNLDYLLENIVDPAALVPQEWSLSIVTLKDGRVLTGAVSRPTDQTFAIQGVEGATTVEADDVAGVQTTALSLMPIGLLNGLGDAEVRDLMAYLMHPRQTPRPMP